MNAGRGIASSRHGEVTVRLNEKIGCPKSALSKGVMANRGILTTPIRKKAIVYIELLYVLVVNFLVSSFNVPYAAIYGLDVVNCVAVLFAIKGCGRVFSRIDYKAVLSIFAALCAVLVLGDTLNAVKPTLVLWAIRNTFRFFGFFIACVSLLEMKDVQKIMNILFVFQFVNVVVSLYQFFVLGLSQDNLGGIFGSASGCNGYSNVYFCILLAYFAIFSLAGKQQLWKLVFVCLSTLSLAAMAELKFYYFEFVAIMLVGVILNAQKVRSVVMAAIAIGVFMVGLFVFAQIFPESYATMTNFDELFAYSSQGMAGYELSRFGAFDEISDLIFNNDALKIIFGVGFGGAEYSSNIDAFVSSFYLTWGDLNYRWFTHQMWFIETGFTGFGLLVLLFVAHTVFSIRQIRKSPQNKAMLQFVALVSLITIVNFWYNCTLRVEAAYLTFFVLSISCIIAKGQGRNQKKTGEKDGN